MARRLGQQLPHLHWREVAPVAELQIAQLEVAERDPVHAHCKRLGIDNRVGSRVKVPGEPFGFSLAATAPMHAAKAMQC